MARTIEEIYNEIVTTKENTPGLDGLTSNSQTAIWRLIFYVCAVVINFHEQLWDLFKKDLEDIRDSAAPQTELWWNYKMKEFQYAPNDVNKGVLFLDFDFVPRYNEIDETKQIIKYSATKQAEGSRQVIIKIAKDDGNNNPQQLTIDELNAAKSYINELQGAGLFINTVSFPADDLQMNVEIFFDGQYVQSNVLNDTKEAIREYLKDLKFDGTIQVIRLIDKIQTVDGVKDIYINSLFGKPDGGAPIEFDRVYDTLAGYARLDEQNSSFTMTVEK